MASIFDASTTAASNTTFASLSLGEGTTMPSSLNDQLRELIAETKGALIGVTASGTDTYTATLAPAPLALVEGMTIHIRFTNANATTTPTLNINSLGAKTIVKEGSAALLAGDIPAGHEAVLRYNGTNWVLLNPKYPTNVAKTDAANTFTADQTIQSSDAGASAGPVLTLDRASASPAVSDELGLIEFRGRDVGGNATSYAAIYANIQATTDGAEDGALVFRTMQSGTPTVAGYFNDGLVLGGSPTGADMGTGTINAKAVYDDGVQLFGPRCVVRLTGLTTTPTITTVFNSLGTLSASRSSAGVYTFSWTTSLTNPTVFLTVRRSSATAFAFMSAVSGTSVTIRVVSPDTTPVDPDEVTVSIYG